jgi:Uma2 family endonuclease
MAMPALRQFPPGKRWTAAEVRELMDGTRPTPRYELVDGELLVTASPIPLHQRAVRLLARALEDYVEAHRLGEVMVSPADIELIPDSIVQPDVFVIPASIDPPTLTWSTVTSLLLAAEILSPSSVRHDRVTKRRFLRDRGVSQYWVVDVDARTIERWTPDDARPEVLDDRLTWHPAEAAEPFGLDLRAYFARVHVERR